MNRPSLLRIIPIFVFTCSALLAEEAKLDRLIVYGEGFAFGVKEPSGWQGDTTNASEVGANLILYRRGETYENAVALIRVGIAKKADENTSADLEADMKDYKKRYSKVEFEDLVVTHPTYGVFAKLFFVPGKFYEYVVYMNPGPKSSELFSVALYKSKKAATPEELRVFQATLESVVLLSPTAK